MIATDYTQDAIQEVLSSLLSYGRYPRAGKVQVDMEEFLDQTVSMEKQTADFIRLICVSDSVELADRQAEIKGRIEKQLRAWLTGLSAVAALANEIRKQEEE